MNATFKIFVLAAFLGGAVSGVSSQPVYSFHPLFSESNAVTIPEIEGKWAMNLFGPDTLSIVRAGDNFYHIRLSSQPPFLYEGVVTPIGQNLFLVLFPINKSVPGDKYYHNHFFAAHSIYKLEVRSEKLSLFELNYAWLYERIEKNQFQLNYLWRNNSLLLTASTEELRVYIAKYQQEGHFFGNATELDLIPGEVRKAEKKAKKLIGIASGSVSPIFQSCIPAFPLKQGWMGGDGNVSVPISHTKTLWLFSDSFVGAKDISARRNTQMISNTAAIMTCNSDGTSTINYFWKDMYQAEPKPIFETGTSRYFYWVSDALLIHDVLYAVLQKTGKRKEPTAPGELFNFEQLGWTLAKVSEPALTDPPGWSIEYLPWSPVFPHNHKWSGQLTKKGAYIYSFHRNNSNGSYLLRFPVQYIDNPQGYLEYYATSGTWKKGLYGKDVAVLFSGDEGQTVEYHDDLKKWIMVIGPGFMNGKIRMRSAEHITGPWSSEQIIFEVPEQKIGSKLFSKENFSYLGREHLQFYDKRKKVIRITYDVNSSDNYKLLSDTSLYTPKVISLSLKGR